MIPKQLTIKGLYSYQNSQTIDFSKLASSSLFGIFGSVGSGKSSILEAITFALYNKTDRLGDRDNRSYNMMNLRSNEMLIEFIFEAGEENATYKIVCTAKRNRKRFEDISQSSRNIYIQKSDSWMPVGDDTLKKDIGLSYENFKRTIIIPQGKFQEFLQLGNKERTKMMKELFHLEKFDLSDKVSALWSENKSKLEHIKGQLEQLGDVNQDQKDQYISQISTLEKEIKEKSDKLEKIQKEEGRLTVLKALSEKLDKAKNKLQNLKKEESYFKSLEARLNQYEQCQSKFKNLIDTYRKSKKRLDDKRHQLQFEKRQLGETEKAIGQTKKEIDKIKTDYENRDELNLRAKELDIIIRIKNQQKEEEQTREDFNKAKKEFEKKLALIEELNTQISTEKSAIESSEKLLPDMAIIGDVKVWHKEMDGLIRQKDLIDKEIKSLTEEISSVEESVEVFLQDPELKAIPANSEFPDVIQYLKSQINGIRKEIKRLDSDAGHYRLQKELESYTKNIEDGKACPLCGSFDHPDVLSIENVDKELNLIHRQIKEHEIRIESFEGKTHKLGEFDLELKSLLKSYKDKTSKKSTLLQDLKNLESQFCWDKKFKEWLIVEKTIDESERIKKELSAHKEMLSDLSTQIDRKNKKKEEEDERIKNISDSLLKRQTEIKTLLSGLQISNISDYQTKSVIEISGERNSLLRKFKNLEESFKRISGKLDDLEIKQARLTGSYDANKNELAREEINNENISEDINKALKHSEFSDLPEVERILSGEIDVEDGRKKVADYKKETLLASDNITKLSEEIADKKYDPEAHQEILEDINALKIRVKEEGERLGSIKNSLKTLIEDLKKIEELSSAKDSLELRASNLGILISLFRGSGFVSYVSSVYLKNLCKAANDRFVKLTRQSLSLELTDDNSFRVRDFLNGGVVRSVKTLSGGQTFQAALSLALALSDNIQHLAGADQNFFFLDEGFGSLDKESLALVFVTLKTLRKENRIVGLISHIEEMQQEIDPYLQITNHAEKGSIIESSWEV